MICQTCQKNEATIHYFESVNGQSRTMNLCEACAAAADLGEVHVEVQARANGRAPRWDRSVYEGLVARPKGELACVGCGLSLEEFMDAREYRCPACRDTFRHALGKEAKVASETAELKAQLEEAVASEDFERAAVLRDKLQEAGHV